jgi:hypothetical protein
MLRNMKGMASKGFHAICNKSIDPSPVLLRGSYVRQFHHGDHHHRDSRTLHRSVPLKCNHERHRCDRISLVQVFRSPLQLGGSNVLLNLPEALWPLLPVVHDNHSLGLLGQELGHLLHLLLTFFNSVNTDVGNARDTSTHGGGGTALAVLDGDDLGRLDAELFARVEVNLGVWLGGWWVEGGSSAVDVLVWEVVVDADLLNGGNNTGLSAGGDDAHLVALLVSPLHHLGGTWAWLALLGQLGGDSS